MLRISRTCGTAMLRMYWSMSPSCLGSSGLRTRRRRMVPVLRLRIIEPELDPVLSASGREFLQRITAKGVALTMFQSLALESNMAIRRDVGSNHDVFSSRFLCQAHPLVGMYLTGLNSFAYARYSSTGILPRFMIHSPCLGSAALVSAGGNGIDPQ